MNSKANTSLLEAIEKNRSVQLSIEKLSKGIDNYHIDVRLSSKFSSDIKKLVALLVSQIAIPKPKHWDNSKAFEKIRSEYLDMMTILIHRVKTDLSADEICFLQFAVIKIILRVTRAKLDSSSEEHTSELQSHHELVCPLLLEKKKKHKNRLIHLVLRSQNLLKDTENPFPVNKAQ